MIAIVVPAHNEEEEIGGCLDSLLRAARHPALAGEVVRIIVVLDHCTDQTAERIACYPVESLNLVAKNVGVARAMGARQALRGSCRWLAFTDADTRVPEDWLPSQLAYQADAVCGTVRLRPGAVSSLEGGLDHYQNRDGHRHVHGCNFGVTASAYSRAGGFPPVRVHEDVRLVEALQRAGRRIAWVANPCVSTSSRLVGRLQGGFACSLRERTLPNGVAA